MAESGKTIYLDVCALCRPFDDLKPIRVRLEAEAVQLILSHVRSKNLTMVVSPAHVAEIGAIEDLAEREHLVILLDDLGHRTTFDL